MLFVAFAVSLFVLLNGQLDPPSLEWIAVSSDLNRILKAIDGDATLRQATANSYKEGSGLMDFHGFSQDYRENCGFPIAAFARENNVTSENFCVWNFIRDLTEDDALNPGRRLNASIFGECAKWVEPKRIRHRQISIGMWAIYENKQPISQISGVEDCETE